MDDLIKDCSEKGYVKTLKNRIRYIPEIKSSIYMQREFGKRMAMNAPIQGTAADIIKLAMIKIDKEFETGKLRSKMIVSVHDELVFDVVEEEREVLVPTLVKMMEEASNLRVRLLAESGIGKDWYSAK